MAAWQIAAWLWRGISILIVPASGSGGERSGNHQRRQQQTAHGSDAHQHQAANKPSIEKQRSMAAAKSASIENGSETREKRVSESGMAAKKMA